MWLWRPDDQLADPATDLLADCHEIERCLLTLARFTGGRRHHARSVADGGAGHVESAVVAPPTVFSRLSLSRTSRPAGGGAAGREGSSDGAAAAAADESPIGSENKDWPLRPQ